MKNKSMLMGCVSLIGCLVYGEVLLDENFDTQLGRSPKCQRATQVKVVDGQGLIGTDPAVRFFDETDAEGGVLEYTAGQAPVGALSITFDLLNNAPDKSGAMIFSAGLWAKGKSYELKSNDTRAFSLIFAQSGGLAVRVGKSSVKKGTYDMQALQRVKVLINDNDSQPLPYIRPDTKAPAMLNPDSVVVWINNELVARQSDSGVKMHSVISAGDAVLGRIGFSSLKADTADFLIDDLHVESISAAAEASSGQ